MAAMIGHHAVDATLRQFLLGALDDQERLAVEARLVADPATFEALALAEGALAEAYVDGELSPEDRQRFERHYLTTTERCRQVTVLRLVRDRARTGFRAPRPMPAASLVPPVAAASSRRLTAWSLALALSLCLAVGWSAWLRVRQASLGRELAAVTRQGSDQPEAVSGMSAEIAHLSARATDLEASAVVPPPLTATGSILPLVAPIAPEYELRSGTRVRVTIPPGAAVVRFRLPLPGATFPAYRAAVCDVDGRELWSVSSPGTVAGARMLRVVAPSELLPRGDYEIRVSGMAAGGAQEPIATFPFRRPS